MGLFWLLVAVGTVKSERLIFTQWITRHHQIGILRIGCPVMMSP